MIFNYNSFENKTPFGALKEKEGCKIKVNCQSEKVFLHIEYENGKEYARYCSEVFDNCCEFNICFAKSGLYFYYFEANGEKIFKTHPNGKWQITVYPENYTVPERFFGRIMYQIFPDRFNKSGSVDLTNKLSPYNIVKDVNTQPAPYGEIPEFYGGNLRGITQKLDYLKDLGVGIIYLNPIFKAYSSHRYDTCDYMTIDEMLGDEEDFEELINEAHKRDILIILDGVFSHTGDDSIYFDRKNRFGLGAYNNRNSPYYEWYDFKDYPDGYSCWWGMKTLPCVNEMSESYLGYMLKNEDSAVKKWMRKGIDGWRLDVADELPDEFLSEFRDTVKKENPDSAIIGEVWEDASNKISYGKRRGYITNGLLDGVMNYPWRFAVISFVKGEISAESFAESVNTLSENYPLEFQNCLMNIISTHDTPRILTLLECGNDTEKAMAKLRICYALMFSLPGIPCIYYGDEINMRGWKDPQCRGYYDWEKESETRETLKSLSKIKTLPSFIKGRVKVDVINEEQIKITRFTENCESNVDATPNFCRIKNNGEIIFEC